MEQIRSEQAVAASTTATPTPVDIVASVSVMQHSLTDLFTTPGLPDVVVESKNACEVLFTEMAAAAQKLAGFEATIRAAVQANTAAKKAEDEGQAAEAAL